MSANSPVQGTTLNNNLLYKQLELPEVQEAVINFAFNYNRIQVITNKIAQGAPSIKSPNYRVEVPVLTKQGISNLLTANAAQSGSNLIITFPGAENRYRVRDLVRDSAGKYGRVTAVSGNTITIEPAGIGQTLTSGTDFKATYVVTNFGNVSGLGTTTGISSLSVTPDLDYALIMKMRDTNAMNLQDQIKTKIIWTKSKKWWYASQQAFMAERHSKYVEMQYVYSERQENVPSVVDGPFNRTGGIYWTARYNGGTYRPLSATITENDLKEFCTDFAKATGDAKTNILLLCGREAMAAIQNFLSPYVYQAGTQNLFGGADLKGFDITTYSFNGVTINVTNYPLFDDDSIFGNYLSTINGKDKASQNIMALNLTPAESANGFGMVPAIQKYTLANAPEMAMRFEPGMNLVDSGWNTSGAGDWSIAQNDLDGFVWQMWQNLGIYVVPQRVGFMEMES